MNNYHRTIVDLCEFPNVESWEGNIKEFNDLMHQILQVVQNNYILLASC
jgi:hypothetical protein